MIPAGYMLKFVSQRSDWIKAKKVLDIYSVSSCVSKDFRDDWISDWSHNGFWLFNDPTTLSQSLKDHKIEKAAVTLFFYLVYEEQWDSEKNSWSSIRSDSEFLTEVKPPVGG